MALVMIMLERFLRTSILFDFYGALLTDKQQQCLEMHFSDDLSLSEIADRLGVSRQAVYDIIHRSEQLLDEYERKLKLVERHYDEQNKLEVIFDELAALSSLLELKDNAAMQRVLRNIEGLLGKSKEA